MPVPKNPVAYALYIERQRQSQSHPLEDKLWRYVEKSDGCWLWVGRSKTWNGYGVIQHKHRALRAHRVSWEIHNGPIPVGLCVLHRCDTPACVCPDHLFLGTDADNNKDRSLKGRSVTGSRCALSNPANRLNTKGIPRTQEVKDKISAALIARNKAKKAGLL